jgi:hypothetical protein
MAEPAFSNHFTLPTSTSYYPYEIPQTSFTPWLDCPLHTRTDLCKPLLVQKQSLMSTPDAAVSRLLQLQTQAAYRASTQPLQFGNGSSSTASDSSVTTVRSSMSTSPSTLCCCRCRCEHGHSGMFQLGTNLYYCSHCAKMVGLGAEMTKDQR